MPQIKASFHNDNPYSRAHLAVNVKVYSDFRKVRSLESWFKRLSYSEDELESFVNSAYEGLQENFWNDTIQEIGRQYHFDKVYSEGRSAGWAIPTINGMELTEDNLTASILTNYHNFKEAVNFVIDNVDQAMYDILRQDWLDMDHVFCRNHSVTLRSIEAWKEIA